MIVTIVGLAWGVLIGVPGVVLARRVGAGDRTRTLAGGARRRMRCGWLRRMVQGLAGSSGAATVHRVVGAPARVRRERRLDDELARQLAVAVDLVGVGIGAGCTPYLAIELAARWAPALVAECLGGVGRACALGQSFDDALRDAGRSRPQLRGLTDALRTCARLGSPVGPALHRLASEVRADLRRRAEARARTVPVRLSFPLVGCILPAFALLTVVPTVMDGLHT